MSNLGLGNLISLKRRLLPADKLTSTTWDTLVTLIGKGVAAAFDRHCNRKFERDTAAVDTFTADRAHWLLNRFPVESIASITQQDDLTAGYVSLGAVASVAQNWQANTGIIQFGGIMGTHLSQVRVTYSGGYWFETSEAENTTQPAGSTLLPEDVREAWMLQAKHAWSSLDKLGLDLARNPSDATSATPPMEAIKLLTGVKEMLAPHLRYQIT